MKQTTISATIFLETYKRAENLKEYVSNILENAPKITGEKGDAITFINMMPGTNAHIFQDCETCPYKATRLINSEGDIQCEAPAGFDCPEANFQTRIVITIIGELKNRDVAQTRSEWFAYKEYIREKFGQFNIKNASCKVI